jgi:hypothetical protein
MSVVIHDRSDALIWRAVDKIFGGADARTVLRDLELDLLRLLADGRLTRVDRLVQLMRETDPARISTRRAA